MKVGTKSVLFGVYFFLWHPILVFIKKKICIRNIKVKFKFQDGEIEVRAISI